MTLFRRSYELILEAELVLEGYCTHTSHFCGKYWRSLRELWSCCVLDKKGFINQFHLLGAMQLHMLVLRTIALAVKTSNRSMFMLFTRISAQSDVMVGLL